MHVLDAFAESSFPAIGDNLGGDKMDVPRDGKEEADLVDKHVVDAQSDIAVLLHDCYG